MSGSVCGGFILEGRDRYLRWPRNTGLRQMMEVTKRGAAVRSMPGSAVGQPGDSFSEQRMQDAEKA